MARRPRKRRRTTPTELPVINVAQIRLRLMGWYLRTLRVETTGEYGKLKRLMELFLVQAEGRLAAHLWDRGTEVSLEEALQHLGLRWGPKFRRPLNLEVRVTDTHLKFSLTVPLDAVTRNRPPGTSKQQQRRELAAERSLYVVRRLANRLQIGPAGRQLVFWRLLRRAPGL